MHETVLFDLGGVLLNLYPERTFRSMELLMNHANAVVFDPISFWEKHAFFNEYEMGMISDESFLNQLANALNYTSTDQNPLINAWNAMLGDFPTERFEWLIEASQQYELNILSNTNSIHVDFFENHIDQRVGLGSFKKLFKNIFYSQELGFRKPNQDIFEAIIHLGIEPSKTLFLEDTEINLEAPKKLGFQTKLVERNQLKKSDFIL